MCPKDLKQLDVTPGAAAALDSLHAAVEAALWPPAPHEVSIEPEPATPLLVDIKITFGSGNVGRPLTLSPAMRAIGARAAAAQPNINNLVGKRGYGGNG